MAITDQDIVDISFDVLVLFSCDISCRFSYT